MKKALKVAQYTFIEVYRSKVMFSILFIAIGLVVVSYVASEFAYGAPAKVALDFGFGLMVISNLVMAIFIGTTLLSKEIESRTLYMILSRPISRISFMFGKILGLSSVLIVNTVLLSSFSVGIYYYLKGVPSSIMIWTAWFSLVEAFIIMLFAVLYSLITSNGLAVIYTIFTWIVGHSFATTTKSVFAKSSLFFSNLLKATSFIIPDLDKINLKDLMIYEQSISLNFIVYTQLYVTFYIAALLLVISHVFKNKNLD